MHFQMSSWILPWFLLFLTAVTLSHYYCRSMVHLFLKSLLYDWLPCLWNHNCICIVNIRWAILYFVLMIIRILSWSLWELTKVEKWKELKCFFFSFRKMIIMLRNLSSKLAWSFIFFYITFCKVLPSTVKFCVTSLFPYYIAVVVNPL